ncbi:LytR family transcriptional regulator, partial [Streptococcus suis]
IEINSSTIPSLLGYSDALSNIKSYQLKGDGQEINGVSYQIVSNDHLLKIQNTIKKALGKKTSKTITTTAITYEDYYGLSSSGDSTDYNQSYGSYSGYDTGGG